MPQNDDTKALQDQIKKLSEQLNTERTQRVRKDLNEVLAKSGAGENIRTLVVDSIANRIDFSEDGRPMRYTNQDGREILLFESDGLLPVVTDIRSMYPGVFESEGDNNTDSDSVNGIGSDDFDILKASDEEIAEHHGIGNI